MSVKIGDLVEQSTIDQLKELDQELKYLVDVYTATAKELSKGLEINIKVIGDMDKLDKLIVEKGKEAAATTERLNAVLREQGEVVANTTNTISRQLMEQERVNKAQREAYTDSDKFKTLMEQINGSYEQRLKRVVQLEREIEQAKNVEKALKDQLKAGAITQAEYDDRMTSARKVTRELAQERAGLVTTIKNEEREMTSVEGSYNNLSQRLELLKKAYKNLTEEEVNSPFGEEMARAIQDLDAHLKDMAADMGEFQRNVGNYAIAGESVKKDLKNLVLEISNLTIEYQRLSEEERNSAKGQALAAHIHELTEQAGELKDAINDTNAAIANAASDTRGFDQLSGALQLAIDGFGLAAGGAEILGISQGELAEVQTKLVAAIAASNAMSKIQNQLQSQSALMQGVTTIQTKLRTMAENMHTAAQGKNIIVTKAATAAQWAFNAAANANPIGLVCVAIIACIAAIWGLVKAFQYFFGVSDKAIEQYKKQKEALEELIYQHDILIERMKARGATEGELLRQSLENKKTELEATTELFEQAKKLYDDDEDEYTEALEAKKNAQEDYEQFMKDSHIYLEKIIGEAEKKRQEDALGTYEYRRQLVEKEIEAQRALARVLFENHKISSQMYSDMIYALNQAADEKLAAINDEEKKANEKAAEERRKAAADRAKQAETAAKELQKKVQEGEDAIVGIIADSIERQRKQEELSYSRKLADLKKQLAETKATEVKLRQALNNQILALETQHANKLLEIEMAVAERRISVQTSLIQSRISLVETGTKEEYDLKNQLLSVQYETELLSLSKLEQDKTVTIEQAEEMRANLVEKYAILREKAEQEFAARQAELVEKRYAQEQEGQNVAYISALNREKQRYARELEAAEGNEAEIARIKEKYELNNARMAEKYAQLSAQSSIDMIEEILKNDELSAEDRLKYEQQLAKAKADLETAIADAAIAEIERTTEADKKASEKRIANAQRWLQAASQAIGAINDLVSTLYDGQLSKIEEEQDANDEAAEKEQERISNLVEQNVITEEEGEARKRAAEEKTAKKNEELEKKKQQIQYKQAIWDKANSVAQVGINTAMAIMQTAAQLGYPAAIPFIALAGAMGAIQLATIIATPIPKYAEGTERHQGGFAVVGDGGQREVVVSNGRMWLTPDTPTLVDLPVGAAVYPSITDYNGISGGLLSIDNASAMPQNIIINDYKRLEEKMDKLIFLTTRTNKISRDNRTSEYIEILKIKKGL